MRSVGVMPILTTGQAGFEHSQSRRQDQKNWFPVSGVTEKIVLSEADDVVEIPKCH